MLHILFHRRVMMHRSIKVARGSPHHIRFVSVVAFGTDNSCVDQWVAVAYCAVLMCTHSCLWARVAHGLPVDSRELTNEDPGALMSMNTHESRQIL